MWRFRGDIRPVPNSPARGADTGHSRLAVRAQGLTAAILFGAIATMAFAVVASAVASDKLGRVAHGDWERRCEPLPDDHGKGPTNSCYLVQIVPDESSGAEVMRAIIGYGPGREQALAVFILPLNVFLPSGVVIRVDDNTPLMAAFQLCSANGCRAVLPLDEGTLDALRSGGEATILVEDGRHNVRRLTLSLRGFTTGFGSL
jgi:invasion protein IalB